MIKHIFSACSKAWKWYKRQYHGRWYQKLATPIATFVVMFYLYLGAVNINFLWLFGMSPDMQHLKNPITNEASLIYSADSVYLGKFFSENRSPVEFDEISPYVTYALLSTEDERFYLHHGIDFKGLFAAMKDIVTGNPRGASTITQQLVKNLFKIRSQYSTGILGKIPGVGILVMKSKEWITAIKIENMYSKEDILTLYLNTVDFGSNAYGIKTAARTYFHTEPLNLTAEQSAVLVGLLKATTTYNPRVNPERSLERRNVVLSNMLAHQEFCPKGVKFSKEICDSLCKLPIDLSHYSVEKTYDGSAQYFREAVRDYLSAWCKENDIDLYSDGLKIYTTLDTRVQAYAEYAVSKQMRHLQQQFEQHWKGIGDPWRDERHQVIPNFIENIAKRTDYYKILDKKYEGNQDSIWYYMNKPHTVKLFAYGKTSDKTGKIQNGFIEKEISTMDSIRYMVSFLHCGFVAMEPETSHVKAWVGDIDFASWKYDKVTSMRQPGSTFKLFVYASAFENNDSITPNTYFVDSPVYMKVPDKNSPTKEKTWAPHNANGFCTYQSMRLSTAFAQSVNTIAVKLGQVTGIDNVAEIAYRMGIPKEQYKLDPTPSLALGSSDVRLIDLINCYSTVMNDGMQRSPILVTKVLDRDGKTIFDSERDIPQAKQAIKYQTAYFMQQLLWGGMREPGGTTQALWSYVHGVANETEFGGKTGTSSNHSDAWFVGATPHLVAGAWIGGEYRCIHFRTGQLGQGSRTSLPVFGYFIDKVLRDARFAKYKGKFPQPKQEVNMTSTYHAKDAGTARPDSSRYDDDFYLDGEELIINHDEATPTVISEENTPTE